MGSIRVSMQDHVAGAVKDLGFRVCGNTVQEVVNGFICLLGPTVSFGCQVIESMEHGVINTAAIVQEFATDLEEAFLLFGCHWCTVVNFS